MRELIARTLDKPRLDSDAILTALDAAGYVIVPREPTKAMSNVGVDARWRNAVRDANCVREIYIAMISAADE